jgi:hypothetical protein
VESSVVSDTPTMVPAHFDVAAGAAPSRDMVRPRGTSPPGARLHSP